MKLLLVFAHMIFGVFSIKSTHRKIIAQCERDRQRIRDSVNCKAK